MNVRFWISLLAQIAAFEAPARERPVPCRSCRRRTYNVTASCDACPT